MISTASFAQALAKTPSQWAAPVAAAGDWSAFKLSGVNVYNEANGNVGEISDVIIESTARFGDWFSKPATDRSRRRANPISRPSSPARIRPQT
jgi:hypothetical protein